MTVTRSKIALLVLTLGLLLAIASPTLAQEPSLEWASINSGAAQTDVGSSSLHGVIGQMALINTTADNTTLQSGFMPGLLTLLNLNPNSTTLYLPLILK
jgi:hypothetical protein